VKRKNNLSSTCYHCSFYSKVKETKGLQRHLAAMPRNTEMWPAGGPLSNCTVPPGWVWVCPLSGHAHLPPHIHLPALRHAYHGSLGKIVKCLYIEVHQGEPTITMSVSYGELSYKEVISGHPRQRVISGHTRQKGHIRTYCTHA
jgi:hypothetical protein